MSACIGTKRKIQDMDGSALAWDLFISHASEDKDSFVRPLATELSRLGLRVWYDEFTLQLGDSISENIDKGLAESGCGLVIISKSFMAKPWPRREPGRLQSRFWRGRLIGFHAFRLVAAF